jgi:hypothetical protein
MPADDTALVTRDGQAIGKGRLSPALKSAVTLIVHDGATVAEAAKRTGYQRESLAKALLKPHVRQFRAGVKRAWLESEAAKAWRTVADLASDAQSEKVRLEAARTILSSQGELTSDSGENDRRAVALIQFIRQGDTHIHGQPLTQRLPGVVQAEDFQDAEYEPLDPSRGLTGPEDA